MMICETDSNFHRDSRNGSNLYHSNKTGNKKPNTDQTTLAGQVCVPEAWEIPRGSNTNK